MQFISILRQINLGILDHRHYQNIIMKCSFQTLFLIRPFIYQTILQKKSNVKQFLIKSANWKFFWEARYQIFLWSPWHPPQNHHSNFPPLQKPKTFPERQISRMPKHKWYCPWHMLKIFRNKHIVKTLWFRPPAFCIQLWKIKMSRNNQSFPSEISEPQW